MKSCPFPRSFGVRDTLVLVDAEQLHERSYENSVKVGVYFAAIQEPLVSNVCVYSEEQKVVVLVHLFLEKLQQQGQDLKGLDCVAGFASKVIRSEALKQILRIMVSQEVTKRSVQGYALGSVRW
jgi:hypothetical protein